jgi:hypothetical protein
VNGDPSGKTLAAGDNVGSPGSVHIRSGINADGGGEEARTTAKDQGMNAPAWIEYLTAFGAVAMPILVVFVTWVGWRFRRSMGNEATNLDEETQAWIHKLC